MGRYYAAAQGEDPSVAAAIEDHYKPVGPSDRVPTDPVAIAVALADKLDTARRLLGDRREADGEQGPLCATPRRTRRDPHRARAPGENPASNRFCSHIFLKFFRARPRLILSTWSISATPTQTRASGVEENLGRPIEADAGSVGNDLLAFFADRLKVQLREQGARHDLVDAVFALGGQDDLVLIVRRVEALGSFLDTEDGATCSPATSAPPISSARRRRSRARRMTARSIRTGSPSRRRRRCSRRSAPPTARFAPPIEVEDFDDAMRALARLRAPVDAFFDKVLVNAPEPELRANRLRLLNLIREDDPHRRRFLQDRRLNQCLVVRSPEPPPRWRGVPDASPSLSASR